MISIDNSDPGHDLFRNGARAFNERRFFDAHEIWEDLWSDRSLPDRNQVQGLIQLATALLHVESGNLTGARSLLAKARKNLEEAGEGWRGLSIALLKKETAALGKHLHEIHDVHEFLPSLILEIRIKSDA